MGGLTRKIHLTLDYSKMKLNSNEIINVTHFHSRIYYLSSFNRISAHMFYFFFTNSAKHLFCTRTCEQRRNHHKLGFISAGAPTRSRNVKSWKNSLSNQKKNVLCLFIDRMTTNSSVIVVELILRTRVLNLSVFPQLWRQLSSARPNYLLCVRCNFFYVRLCALKLIKCDKNTGKYEFELK